jgi:hypothetical protein
MAGRTISEHAQITAICVNFALDALEADIREELSRADEGGAVSLKRILARLEQRRLSGLGVVGPVTAQ